MGKKFLFFQWVLAHPFIYILLNLPVILIILLNLKMQLIFVVDFLKVIICYFLGIDFEVVHGLFWNVDSFLTIKFVHRSVFLGQRWHSYNILFIPLIFEKMVWGVDEIPHVDFDHLGQLLLSLICLFFIIVDLLIEAIKICDVPAIFCFQSLIRLNPHSRIQLPTFWFGHGDWGYRKPFPRIYC